MKLKTEAIEAIKANRKLINLLAISNDSHSGTIERWVRENRSDGELTKISNLELISTETGFTTKGLLTK